MRRLIEKRKSSYRCMIVLGLLTAMVLAAFIVDRNSSEVSYLLTTKTAETATTESTTTTATTRVTVPEVIWEIPADIAGMRNKECADKSEKVTKTGGFCIGNEGVNYMKADKKFANSLAKFFDGDSVVDLGAGEGWYGKIFLNHATHPVSSYHGFDGALNVEEITKGFVKHMDLTQPSPVDRRSCGNVADWVLSVEVAEHIPPEFTDSFLRNVRCRARKGAIISWAVPGQLGVGHVNNKPFEDSKKLIERWGFKLDMHASEALRKGTSFPWIKGTVSVYRLE